MLTLTKIKRTEYNILKSMAIHYSQPKGFVGRNICYSVHYNNILYGHIVGGSSTLHLPGRNEFFSIDKSKLNNIVNNIFYHIEKVDDKYPLRNFSIKVLEEYRKKIQDDWYKRYKNIVLGHETLVELPRTGEIYIRDGWIETGITKGYTCKRIEGKGTDSWSGKRVWNTKELRPKRVFCRNI